MSKIAKAITCQVNGHDYRSEPIKLDYTKINFETETISGTLGRAIKYRIGFKLETSALADENQDPSSMIEATKRAMIEEIFGEFRPLLYKLRASLYDRDLREADKIAAELDHIMFREGL